MKSSPLKKGSACTTHALIPETNCLKSPRTTAFCAPLQVDSTPLVSANALPDELWVLTRPLASSDPIWGEQTTIIGSPERIRSMFDLSRGVPWPWRLLKNKKARRFLRDSLREELRYRRDKSAREKAGDN